AVMTAITMAREKASTVSGIVIVSPGISISQKESISISASRSSIMSYITSFFLKTAGANLSWFLLYGMYFCMSNTSKTYLKMPCAYDYQLMVQYILTSAK